MKKYSWIYNIRGLAIIAVVVCHQFNILHTSEWVQMFTLYSVTTLILLAGITQGMWFKKNKVNSEKTILGLMIKKLVPIILSYVVATMAYLSLTHVWVGIETDVLWSYLITFTASGPFYFIKYYIALTIISPVLFCIVKKISVLQKYKYILYIISFGVIFEIGYALCGKFDLLGQSYLAVYYLGLIIGFENNLCKKKKTRIFAVLIDIPIFLFAVYSVKQFYFRRVAGICEPIGIDVLVPKLQMNPPNFSVILYSLSFFVIAYIFFSVIEENEKFKSIQKLFKPLEIIGKYSMDIFIWHMFIQNELMGKLPLENICIKRIIYYLAMFYIPVLGRVIYNCLKKEVRKSISE